jgi:photosystem II stability/assembly factor-like uncharacterized protein
MSKTFTLLLLLTLSISGNLYPQSGWFWQYPLPEGNILYSVKIVDNNTAYACGACGTIIKTTNQGNSWYLIKTDSGYINTSLFFYDVNTGWATSGEGLYAEYGPISKLYKTTNGGINWVLRFSLSGSRFISIDFVGLDTGYLLARNNAWGIIYRTTDAGYNWSQVYSTNVNIIYKSFFLNSVTGYVCGPGILKTTNAGINWVNQYQYPAGSCTLNSIYFTDSNTGFAVGSVYQPPTTTYRAILRTSNGGANWDLSMNITVHDPLYSVYMLNSMTGFAGGYYPSLITTNNGGLSWYDITPVIGQAYMSIDFRNSNLGFIVGGAGIFLKTTNFGLNWIDQFPSLRLGYGVTCIQFFNKYVGYATTGNHVLKTTNSGNNWTICNTPTTENLRTLAVTDTNIIYTGGGYIPTVLLKSTNGGLNWVTQNSNLDGCVSMSFINSSTGYCLGNGLSKTTDGGNNWSVISSYECECVDFVDENTGYLVVYNGAYKTTDGGNNWFSIPGRGHSVYFINSNTGFTANENMKICKTIDGGMSWITQTQSQDSWDLYGIHFFDLLHGFAVGEFGAIVKTTNGGINWYYQAHLTNEQLISVYMTDTNECYAAGLNNTIIKTTTGGSPIAVRNNGFTYPCTISVFQNYPNPFNPVTRIKFDLPKSAQVRLIIYDILGREDATLVNEQLKPGSYEVQWDGSTYASGIYFYRLETGEFIETKKMVLIK